MYLFKAEFEDPFNSLTSGSIITDPVDIVHSYVGKIRALLERVIREGGGRDGIKAAIAQKIIYFNEKADEVYERYLRTEMLPLHPDLNNFEGVFMEWVDNIVTKLDNYTELGSGSVVLFIGSLDINVGKFKKNFILRGGRGRWDQNIMKI